VVEEREITKREAWLMYLEQNYDMVLPFESKIDYDFITLLKKFNIKVKGENND